MSFFYIQVTVQRFPARCHYCLIGFLSCIADGRRLNEWSKRSKGEATWHLAVEDQQAQIQVPDEKRKGLNDDDGREG